MSQGKKIVTSKAAVNAKELVSIVQDLIDTAVVLGSKTANHNTVDTFHEVDGDRFALCLKLEEVTLSDGSKVYNLIVS